MQSFAPVEMGLAKSLGRPGGNVTGVAFVADTYAGKVIDLLRATRTGLQRIGICHAPDNRLSQFFHDGWKTVADRARVTLVKLPWPNTVGEVDATLAAALHERVQAVEFGGNRALRGAGWERICAWALQNKVLTSAGTNGDGEAMLGFGANGPHFFGLLMDQLDRVLRGAKPADLPIQMPSLYDIIVNKRQLQAIGIMVPTVVLLQATVVFE